MFRNVRIGLRLVVGFFLIFLLLISLTIFAINQMGLLSNQTVLIYNHPLTVSNAVLRINTHIIKIHRSMKDIVLVNDIESIEQHIGIVDLEEQQVFKDFEIINGRFLGDKELYDKALEVFTLWKPIRDRVIALIHKGRIKEAADITLGPGAQHVIKIERAMEKLGNFAQEKAREFLQTTEVTTSNTFNTMYFLVGISILISIYLAISITKSLTAPIRTLREATEKIGRGELDTVIDINSKDEFGYLAGSFNKMTADLNKITTSRDKLNMEIEERKKVETELIESEELHRITLSNISDAVFITDNDGTFTFICPNVNFIFGYSLKEVQAMSNISKLLGDDLFSHDELISLSEIANIERTIADKSGSQHAMLINVKHVSIKGGTVLYTCHDITERKQDQEEQTRLRLRLEALWEIGQIIDADQQVICDNVLSYLVTLTKSQYGFYGFLIKDESVMRIHSWSKEAMKDCGIHNKPIDFPIEKSGVWGNAIRERHNLIINDMKKDYPFKIGLPEGHVGINRLMVVPVFRDNHIIAVGAVANKKDDYTEMDADVIDKFMHSAHIIQDKKKAEEELKKHRDHLKEMVEDQTKELKKTYMQLNDEITEKLNYQAEAFRTAELAAVGELAAGVAHEINNPINGIINFAQILSSKSEPESKDREIADTIMKEGDRIADIVASLLSFARANKEDTSVVQACEIVSETIVLLDAQLKKDGIELKSDIPEDLTLMVNSQQIMQVFLNIINNARYAINEKYPDYNANKIITIKGESTVIDNKTIVRLTFLDNGKGIPYDILNKIINPFFTTKPANQGTGLGLSISHGIINDHGGTLQIDSVYGEFTKVIIDLPANIIPA